MASNPMTTSARSRTTPMGLSEDTHPSSPNEPQKESNGQYKGECHTQVQHGDPDRSMAGLPSSRFRLS